MKELFTISGRLFSIVDKERLIISIDNGHFYDIYGNAVPAEESFIMRYEDEKDDDPWDNYWIDHEGLDEKLISESTIEVEWDIDEGFGNFGFKNRAGEFVIEPQYEYAHEFTCGLASVNLKRTWYRTPEGRRYYENHYGYINERGETVIPFAYDAAWPFNKYGIAVVETLTDSHLIDTKGNIIEEMEPYDLWHYYDYEDRFIKFTYHTDIYDDNAPFGLYDTKERKILFMPSVDDVIEWNEDEILIYMRDGEYGGSDFRQYYINSKGEKKYPWLLHKGFSIVERPNANGISVVAVTKFFDAPEDARIYSEHNGKKYERRFFYGLYSAKEKFIVPTEYEKIIPISDVYFACYKEGAFHIIMAEEQDW